jgi:hypothetical protein
MNPLSAYRWGNDEQSAAAAGHTLVISAVRGQWHIQPVAPKLKHRAIELWVLQQFVNKALYVCALRCGITCGQKLCHLGIGGSGSPKGQ